MKLFDKNGIDMCEGPLFGKIILFSVPLMLTNILQLLYNAADIVVIGAFRGTIQVAAVGATSSFIALIVNVFMGLSVGVSVAVGKYIGQGRRGDVRETVQTTAGLSLVCGLLAMAVGMLLSRPMLVLMKTPEDVLPFALVYLRIYLLGSPANLAYNFLAAVLRAKGDTTRPFLILSTAGLVNVILNVICVALIGMDAEGVAIATVVSQYLSAVLIIICMVRSTDDCRLELRKICLRRDKVAEITRMGLPSGIQGSVFSLSTMVIQSAVNSFGAAVIAGNTAAGSVDSFSYAIHNAFHYTSTSFVAQNSGAEKYDRVSKSVRVCFFSAIVAAIVSGTAIYLAAHPLLSLYLRGDEEAIACGTVRLKYICLLYFLLAMMDVMSGSLRGLGCALVPTVISLIGSCGLRVLWIYTAFRANPTLDMLYLAYPITWGATFAALAVAYFIIRRKREKESAAKK